MLDGNRKSFGNHLQELIISAPNNSQSLSQVADAAVSQAAVSQAAVSQAKQELDSLNKKRCWELNPTPVIIIEAQAPHLLSIPMTLIRKGSPGAGDAAMLRLYGGIVGEAQ